MNKYIIELKRIIKGKIRSNVIVFQDYNICNLLRLLYKKDKSIFKHRILKVLDKDYNILYSTNNKK